ncbi:hypothetical protein OKW46_001019 [Paraburkholderia sp. WSM4179]|nr:hypothetical protein [Paraburkholderia sp. WSM4179]
MSRALAAISSLFAWWHRTGYLTVNPAEGLAAGLRARLTWTPVRFLPAAALTHCDAVAAGDAPAGVPPVLWLRRRAIWALYRYGGVRLAAFGEQRERFRSAHELQQYAGIAPVTERSGKKSWVHWRWQCPKFLRQTFVRPFARARSGVATLTSANVYLRSRCGAVAVGSVCLLPPLSSGGARVTSP